MWSESEIHESCYSQNYEAGKVIDETLEKARNLDFSEVHDEKEAIDQIFEKLEIRPELLVYLKDNFFFMTWTIQMKKTSEMYCVLS